MSNLYITKQNTKLSKKGKRIVVKEEGKIISDIPLINIEQVVVFGRVSITGAMIQLLLGEGIPITYLSYYGNYKGRLVPEYSKNSIFRIKQFRAYEDENFCLDISKRMIKGKLKNMRSFLLIEARKNKKDKIKEVCEKIKRTINKLEQADNLEKIRGYEGIASKYYFSKFNAVLDDEFNFDGRNRRPPKDPINSMLSFGYCLLLNNVLTALYLNGFDPYIGFFHSVQYGKVSLALDLIEEFRQVIIDRLIKSLVNREMITKGDFIKKENKVLMKDKARNLFLESYEEKLETTIEHPVFKIKASWRKIIELQAKLLRKHIKKEEIYQPMLVR